MAETPKSTLNAAIKNLTRDNHELDAAIKALRRELRDVKLERDAYRGAVAELTRDNEQPGDVDDALARTVAWLRGLGIDPARVVLAIVDDHSDDQGTAYATHVGETEDRGHASLLCIIADDVAREARQQGVFLAGGDPCPACGSRRFGPTGRTRPSLPHEKPGYYRDVWDECMSCGFKGPKR